MRLSEYSDQFILFEYNYYHKHLLSYCHGREMIRGLFHLYEAEAKKRNLL